MIKLFNKYDNIYLEDEGTGYQCICEDEDTAIFAKIAFNKNGESYVNYQEMFAYSNNENINTLKELNVVNFKGDLIGLIDKL